MGRWAQFSTNRTINGEEILVLREKPLARFSASLPAGHVPTRVCTVDAVHRSRSLHPEVPMWHQDICGILAHFAKGFESEIL
jgi:hypothetical protein